MKQLLSAFVLVGALVLGFGRQFFTIHFQFNSGIVLGAIALVIVLIWVNVETSKE